MLFIQWNRVKAILPQMAAPTVAAIDECCILAVRARYCAAKTIYRRRHKDEMHMIWHQAVCNNIDASQVTPCRQQRPVKRIVAVVEERCLTTISPFGSRGGEGLE